MAHREETKKKTDNHIFTKTAQKTKTINVKQKIQRGGTRL